MVLPGRSVHHSVKFSLHNLRRQYYSTQIGPRSIPLPEFIRLITSLSPLDILVTKAIHCPGKDLFRLPSTSVIILEDAVLALQEVVDRLAILGRSSAYRITIPLSRHSSSTILTELAGNVGAGVDAKALAWSWGTLTERMLDAAYWVEKALDLRTSRSTHFASKFNLPRHSLTPAASLIPIREPWDSCGLGSRMHETSADDLYLFTDVISTSPL
ncbi:hypothetical protein C8R47DRAFT_1274513 [Mycena vitilis]|nr:hypothetical protein C8R47DRAFT_1274513 [Mycena vitilis]